MSTEPFVDYYALLGIPSSSTSEAIKDAFRSKMRHWHPDVNNSPEATQITQQLIVAYKILLDSEARERYDMRHNAVYGENSAKENSHTSMGDAAIHDDPILARWIASARRAAEAEWKTFPKDFVDAGTGIGKHVGTGVWVIIFWILGFLIAFAIGTARR